MAISLAEPIHQPMNTKSELFLLYGPAADDVVGL